MNFIEKLVKKSVDKRIAVIVGERTPEQEVIYQEQLRLQKVLGFTHGDNTQNWLRMHQIMLDHENRLKHMESLSLETRDGHTDNKG